MFMTLANQPVKDTNSGVLSASFSLGSLSFPGLSFFGLSFFGLSLSSLFLGSYPARRLKTPTASIQTQYQSKYASAILPHHALKTHDRAYAPVIGVMVCGDELADLPLFGVLFSSRPFCSPRLSRGGHYNSEIVKRGCSNLQPASRPRHAVTHSRIQMLMSVISALLAPNAPVSHNARLSPPVCYPLSLSHTTPLCCSLLLCLSITLSHIASVLKPPRFIEDPFKCQRDWYRFHAEKT